MDVLRGKLLVDAGPVEYALRSLPGRTRARRGLCALVWRASALADRHRMAMVSIRVLYLRRGARAAGRNLGQGSLSVIS
jgi:hypothetical protein